MEFTTPLLEQLKQRTPEEVMRTLSEEQQLLYLQFLLNVTLNQPINKSEGGTD